MQKNSVMGGRKKRKKEFVRRGLRRRTKIIESNIRYQILTITGNVYFVQFSFVLWVMGRGEAASSFPFSFLRLLLMFSRWPWSSWKLTEDEKSNKAFTTALLLSFIFLKYWLCILFSVCGTGGSITIQFFRCFEMFMFVMSTTTWWSMFDNFWNVYSIGKI